MARVHALTLSSKRPCKNRVIAIKCSPRLQETEGVSLIFVLLVKNRLHSLTIFPSTFPSWKGNKLWLSKCAGKSQCSRNCTTLGRKQSPGPLSLPQGPMLQRTFYVCKMLGKVGNKCVQDLQTFYLVPLSTKAWAYYCSLLNKS